MITKAQKYKQAFEEIRKLTPVKSPFRQTEFYARKLHEIDKIAAEALKK